MVVLWLGRLGVLGFCKSQFLRGVKSQLPVVPININVDGLNLLSGVLLSSWKGLNRGAEIVFPFLWERFAASFLKNLVEDSVGVG